MKMLVGLGHRGVGLGVGVGVGGTVAVAVGVGVGVGAPPLQKSWTVSILQPESEPTLSLPMRQRRRVGCPLAAAGRFTTVVRKPPELPLQARRPPIGLNEPAY